MERDRATSRLGKGAVVAALLAGALVASCGSQGSPSFDSVPKPDASLPDVVDSGDGFDANADGPILNTDAAVDAHDAADTSPPCTANVKTDAKNCGSCGHVCGTGQSCVNGACACAPYSTFCNGQCIPTSVDPANCGGCGIACTGAQACSAGKCESGCLPGLSICSNSCVDLANDSDHCGACGTKCPVGEGCVKGHCADSITLAAPDGGAPDGGADGGAPACTNGGPPINLGPTNGGCLGGIAQTTFDWSLCSCTDLAVSAVLMTDAYDSTQGPYQPGQLGGGVGVDRDVTLWSDSVTIGGTFSESGQGTYHSSASSEVKTDMHLGGSWSASSPLTVDGNMSAVGTLSGVTVKGTSGTVASVPPPCDCAPSKIIPIAHIVSLFQTANDDTAIGLSPTALESTSGARRLDLPCGVYYLTKISTSNALTIAAHGNVALLVGGDVSASDALALVLDPGASLDIFIAGNLKASDSLVIGSPNYPALSRTYVGGTDTLRLSGDVRLGGELYAANALVDWSAANDIYGAVFAGSFKASAATRIHYDRGVLGAGAPCPPIGGGDAGTPTCGSCKDCGNQACVQGACGSCTNSSECCGPLSCVNGKCVPVVN